LTGKEWVIAVLHDVNVNALVYRFLIPNASEATKLVSQQIMKQLKVKDG
jgi:hypothetical protein